MRWRSFARFLPDHGWTVETVTARLNPTSDELSASPRVARLSARRAHVMGTVGRVARPAFNRTLHLQPEAFPPSMLWGVSGRRRIRRRVLEYQPDAVVVTVPPFAALFAARALRGMGIPLVADMRDPWAEHPTYDAGGKLLTALEDRGLRGFDAIVVVTPGMAERLARLHPRQRSSIELIPNGFAPELLIRRVSRSDVAGRRARLIHPGVLYGDRSLDDLIGGIGRAGLEATVDIELVGNTSSQSEDAIRLAPPELEIRSVGPLGWEDTMTRVVESDIVVVIVPESMGDDVAWPVKMFEALALGKPILAITSGGATECLLRELGQDAGCARVGDQHSVAVALRRLLTDPPAPVEPARLRGWDRARLAGDYAALLDQLVT